MIGSTPERDNGLSLWIVRIALTIIEIGRISTCTVSCLMRLGYASSSRHGAQQSWRWQRWRRSKWWIWSPQKQLSCSDDAPRYKTPGQTCRPKYDRSWKSWDAWLWQPRWPARVRDAPHVGESVLVTGEASFDAVATQSPAAARLLGLLASMNFNDIFLRMFNRTPDGVSPQPVTVSLPAPT